MFRQQAYRKFQSNAPNIDDCLGIDGSFCPIMKQSDEARVQRIAIIAVHVGVTTAIALDVVHDALTPIFAAVTL